MTSREAEVLLSSLKLAAKLLPRGTEIRLRDTTLARVRALAEVSGVSTRIFFYRAGELGVPFPGDSVIETIQVPLGNNVYLDTAAPPREVVQGDYERSRQRPPPLDFSVTTRGCDTCGKDFPAECVSPVSDFMGESDSCCECRGSDHKDCEE